MRLVIDASIMLRWFLEDERTPELDALRYRVVSGQDEVLVLPHLFAECYSGLTRILYREPHRLMPATAREQLAALEDLPLEIAEPAGLYKHSLTQLLSHKLHPSMAYDTIYLALAELLDLPLWTGDARFFYALRPVPSRVTLVPSNRSQSGPSFPSRS